MDRMEIPHGYWATFEHCGLYATLYPNLFFGHIPTRRLSHESLRTLGFIRIRTQRDRANLRNFVFHASHASYSCTSIRTRDIAPGSHSCGTLPVENTVRKYTANSAS